jgi:hypothetical protein
MTSQGTASGRFTRAIQRRNLFDAEIALREMGTPSLLVALNYLELLADVRPDKFDRAAVKWHGRLELEATVMTLAESELALAALGALRGGDKEGAEILRRLLRRVRPPLIRRNG